MQNTQKENETLSFFYHLFAKLTWLKTQLIKQKETKNYSSILKVVQRLWGEALIKDEKLQNVQKFLEISQNRSDFQHFLNMMDDPNVKNWGEEFEN